MRFSAGFYQVSETAAPDTRWQAQQTITLTALDDTDALLRLLATLQHQNLVTDDISWTLAADAEASLRQQAIQLALKSLQDQAAADAHSLGLKVDRYVTITVDDDAPIAGPMRMRMMAAALAPTVDRPDDARIEASVHADVILSP